MNKLKNITQTITTSSFILLWGSAALLKLQDVSQWRRELKLQILPSGAADVLWWLLPAIHVVLIIVLLYKPTVKLGIQLSTVLIGIYTLYLFLGVTRVFGSTPCACGGLWPTNDHWLHIGLNSIFMVLGIGYWVLAHRSRPAGSVPLDVRRKEDTALS